MPKRRMKKVLKRSLKLSHRDILMLLIGATFTFLVFKALDTPAATTPLSAQKSTVATGDLPAAVKQWERPIVEMAHKYNIDADLVAIIMTIESSGNPEAVSHVGAQGLMQVMPYTAEDIAAKHLKQPIESYDLKEPHTNIEFGAAYLAYLRDEFSDVPQDDSSGEGTVKLIAAGYNGGPGAAIRLQQGQQIDPETVDYTEKAVKLWLQKS